MKLKYILPVVSLLLLLTACGNQYEKRMENLEGDIQKLGDTNEFTFPRTTDTTQTGIVQETPSTTNEEPKKEDTTNSQVSTQFSTLDNIQFSGNSGVNTYPDSMKILYEEFKREHANYETTLKQLKEGTISTALAIENLNQVLNSTIVKKEVLESKEVPSNYTLSFSKFNELFKKSILLEIDILTKNLSNIEQPSTKKTKDLDDLNKQLNENEYNLFDEYQVLYSK